MSLLALFALFGVPLAFAAVEMLGSATLPMVFFTGTALIVCFGLLHSYPHESLGACNGVTLFRAALVAFLVGAIFVPSVSGWLVFGVATFAFALDGVDGWLARRSGLASAFGARFDMETDAALAATVSLWALVQGTTGPEILILGFMRYAFFAASFIWPVLQRDLPEAFRRKVVCVIQIATLLLAICPLMPQTMILPLVVACVLLVAWSFLVDILWLTRRAA